MGYKLMQKYWKFIHHYGIEKKKKNKTKIPKNTFPFLFTYLRIK